VAARQVHLEQLLGRRVFAPDGRAAGRIEEIRARASGGSCHVVAYHLGPAALLERLSARFVSRAHGYEVPWDKLDLSDANRPRLLCPVEALRRRPWTSPRR
jgi:hypothetical protein